MKQNSAVTGKKELRRSTPFSVMSKLIMDKNIDFNESFRQELVVASLTRYGTLTWFNVYVYIKTTKSSLLAGNVIVNLRKLKSLKEKFYENNWKERNNEILSNSHISCAYTS